MIRQLDAEERLREDALSIVEAGLAQVEPDALVADALTEHPLEGGADGGVVLLAVGKAALGMAEGARRALGDRIAEACVLVPHGAVGAASAGIRIYHGGHPLPDMKGVQGARALADAARRAGPGDRVLLLLSGGASALLTLPDGEVTLEDVRSLTRLLLASGAPIEEMNTVRKHADALKGGRLARIATPAPVRALVLSDVVGDALDVIGSGPVSPDPTTYSDAIAVLERRGIWDAAPESVRRHLLLGREGRIPETPKPGDALFSGVDATVIGSWRLAAAGAAARALALGYRVKTRSIAMTGEARMVGAELAREARALHDRVRGPTAHIAAGETTVTVVGDGMGGRNQEVALGAALVLDGIEDALVLSLGTDGIDGPTDAAGAIATGTTIARARAAGLDAEASLRRNDAYRFFEPLSDLIVTGPTGTNVMDLFVVLVGG